MPVPVPISVAKKLRCLIHLKVSVANQGCAHHSQLLRVFMQSQQLLITSNQLHQFQQLSIMALNGFKQWEPKRARASRFTHFLAM
jgi:hypothetical protein